MVGWIWFGSLIVFAGGLDRPLARPGRGPRADARAAVRARRPGPRARVARPRARPWTSSARSSSSCCSAPSCCSSPLRCAAASPSVSASATRAAGPTWRPRGTRSTREIRDLEMDHRTGKLSDEDWRALDRDLRAEAVDILHELDQLGDRSRYHRGAMTFVLSALCVFLSIVVIFLVLMHSGKDAGLSGAFGVGTGAGLARRRLARRAQPEPLDRGAVDRSGSSTSCCWSPSPGSSGPPPHQAARYSSSSSRGPAGGGVSASSARSDAAWAHAGRTSSGTPMSRSRAAPGALGEPPREHVHRLADQRPRSRLIRSGSRVRSAALVTGSIAAFAGPWPAPASRTSVWLMTWCRPYQLASIA